MDAPLKIAEILRALSQHGVEFVVVGGVAAVLRALGCGELRCSRKPAGDADDGNRLAAGGSMHAFLDYLGHLQFRQFVPG